MQKKLFFWFIAVIAVTLGSWIYLIPKLQPKETAVGSTANVRDKNGTQIVEILAKGGYSPRITVAKADVPTVIRVHTDKSYDCSVALTVPKLRFRKFLGPKDTVDVPVPADRASGTLRGLCSMGMYSFEVQFK